MAIGISYGRVANNLPSPSQVVALLRSRGVTEVKIYDAAHDVLSAFANSGINLSVAVTNQEVPVVANSQAAANGWVQDNVRAFIGATSITSVGVGNEFLADGSNDSSKLLPAMQNIQSALDSQGLGGRIKVSTPHSFTVMGPSSPPSAGAFKDENFMRGILEFLRQKGSPFMINVYPFFAYRDPNSHISLDFAVFNPNAQSFTDPGNGRTYSNLFDAQVDSVFAATNRLGYSDVPLTITESGWASAGGGLGATVQDARTYNNNLVQHVLRSGTPLRPNVRIPTFIFALFNENQKGGDPIENNFGLFFPNEQPVYDINLSSSKPRLAAE